MALRRYRAEAPKQTAMVDQKGRVSPSWSIHHDALTRVTDFRDVDVAHNPASLTTGAWELVAVACQGARAGNFAAASFDPPNQYIEVTATVASADVITVKIWNVGPGTVDLPAGTLRVRYWSHNP